MSDGFAYLEIIFFAMVAGFIALRLRSVLGRRTGNERRRPDAFSTAKAARSKDNVVPLPERAVEPVAESADGAVAAGLASIRQMDPTFDAAGFINGAKAAFAMIIEAFAKGDKDALRPLLAPDVLQRFGAVIDERARKGELLTTELVATRIAEIVTATSEGSRARLTVRFQSDQINVTRNAQGAVAEGDPSGVEQVVDLWTFERDTRSRDPNWRLVETRTPTESVAVRLTGLAALGLLLLAGGCGRAPSPEKAKEPEVKLTGVEWSAVPGWAADDPTPALAAFRTSCSALVKKEPSADMGRPGWSGKVHDWLPVCQAAAGAGIDARSARQFFESNFAPFAVASDGNAEGLFTGYYEPLLSGSRTPGNRYSVPLHGRPQDLVSVDLGQFDPELEGKRIAGRIDGPRLVPYPTRAEIDAGALDGRHDELLWVDDPVAKFFMQIQGSGLVQLDDGELLRVGYADQNGRPYRAIGRDLVDMGAIDKDKLSLQGIRDWLRAHPREARGVMEKDPSYIFFREVGNAATTPGPLGAQGVPLTPERSLAVDRRYVPLGVPIWLDTTAPFNDGERPVQRMMVAQDSGGAIRGPIRGDLFWGTGAEAENVAGHMKSSGRWYVVLPRSLVPSA